MKIITAGNKYLDIDAYASGIAYAVLLNGLGIESCFVSGAKLNKSIPEFVKNFEFEANTTYVPLEDDEFILVDVSNPDFFDKIVDKNKIIEVIDHHTGFEEYWDKHECKNQIEFIGSVATIIFEKFVQFKKTDLLSQNLCKLLICAILDNTLNLKGSITTKRDIDAFNKLMKIGKIHSSFVTEYFIACQHEIDENILTAIENDIKMEFVNIDFPEVFGQITIYDKDKVFDKLSSIAVLFEKFNKPWMINIICLKDGKSYIYTTNTTAQRQLENLFKIQFNSNILKLESLMLRKEILKYARTKINL